MKKETIVKKNPLKPRNPAARILRTNPAFRQRIVKSKSVYSRKNAKIPKTEEE